VNETTSGQGIDEDVDGEGWYDETPRPVNTTDWYSSSAGSDPGPLYEEGGGDGDNPTDDDGTSVGGGEEEEGGVGDVDEEHDSSVGVPYEPQDEHVDRGEGERDDAEGEGMEEPWPEPIEAYDEGDAQGSDEEEGWDAPPLVDCNCDYVPLHPSSSYRCCDGGECRDVMNDDDACGECLTQCSRDQRCSYGICTPR
jgi:hypothetical protein